MLGLAVGDALGAPVEGVGTDDLGGEHTEMTGGGVYGLEPGHGTADTGITLTLASCLIEQGGFDAGRVLGAFVRWFRSDPPGLSEHMRQVLSTVEGGADAY